MQSPASASRFTADGRSPYPIATSAAVSTRAAAVTSNAPDTQVTVSTDAGNVRTIAPAHVARKDERPKLHAQSGGQESDQAMGDNVQDVKADWSTVSREQ